MNGILREKELKEEKAKLVCIVDRFTGLL